MTAPFFRRPAEALERALASRAPANEREAELLSVAAELREIGAHSPTPEASPARREELRAAVLAQRNRAAEGGGLGRARGAVFGVAALAGAGLVVASAATGSNPVALVTDVALQFPKLAPRTDSGAAASVAIEGEVIATHDGGRRLEVRSDADTVVVVEAPRESRAVTEGGAPVPASDIAQGDTVRVTTDREPRSGTVAARKIEVIPTPENANPAATVPVAAVPGDIKPPTGSNTSPVETPWPSPTRTATPTPTPKPAVSSAATPPAIDPVPSATPTPTRTSTPEPKRTPSTGVAEPIVSDDDNASDSNGAGNPAPSQLPATD